MKKLVIIPGGFHPFHAGHMALYDAAKEKFPSADIYVAASDDQSQRSFPFEIKKKLAQLSGVPAHRFIQVKSPFGPTEITNHYDPDSTQLIYVKSLKNAKTGPYPEGPFPQEVDPATGQLPLIKKGPRKGQPVSDWLQYYKRNGLAPMSQHGYLDYLPVKEFSGMTSGSEIRAKWVDMDNTGRGQLVNILYPDTVNNDRLTTATIKLINKGLGIKDVAENFGGGGLQGAPVGGGAMNRMSVKMPNGPDNPGELVEDPTQEEPMTPTYTPGENFGLDSGSVEDVNEQNVDSRRHMIKQVFQSGKDFVKHLNSMSDNELEALYHERPQMRELMKQLHAHVNEAMQSKVLDAPSHQASDYIEEN